MRVLGLISISLLAAFGAPRVASAGAVYSESFDGAGFQGIYIANQADERSASTPYYTVLNNNGWVFSGTAFYSTVGGDGAVTLNEAPLAATAAKTVTGLIPNYEYQLAFTVTGDNIANALSELRVSVNGTQVADVLHSWTVNGLGTQVVVGFTTTTGSANLLFAEVDRGNQASPAINNVSITPVPEPASLAVVGAGLLGMAVMRRRRRG